MKIGYIGAGRMVDLIAPTISKMDTAHNYAIASRDIARAEAAAQKHGFTKAYGSYTQLLSDPDVDLVYIVTDMSHHFEQAMLALEYGKPVLCEKAFTATAKQAQDLVAAFEAKKIFLAEAIWPRYIPFRKTLEKILADGLIGEPKLIIANLGFPVSHVERVSSAKLAGGALLDIGVYPINFAAMMFGTDIEDIHSTAILTPAGVDEHNSITLRYKNGRMASLCSSMSVRINRNGTIYGTNGLLEIDNVNNPTYAKLYDLEGQLLQKFTAPPQISGYEYQIEACAAALAAGKLECEEMPHSEIVTMMEWMGDMRKSWGVEGS